MRDAATIASALDAVRQAESGERRLNAFLALAEAPERVEGGRLAGRTIAVKDNIATLDLPTTCGSRILDGYRSPYEATAVRKVRGEGGFVFGKTNMDEFGMGSSTENSAFGPTLNPRDRTRVPGGSSGGSAAAVAAGYVDLALGSDTGGSVRQPAALCGVVGIKPTYGRVSRYGLVAYASSLDQIGTFGRSVGDAALLLDVVSGLDQRDATSRETAAPDLTEAAGRGAGGCVIGVPELEGSGIDESVREAMAEAVRALERTGAEVRVLPPASGDVALAAYYVLAPAEASSNLSRYDGVRFGHRGSEQDTAAMYERTRSTGFGAEVKRRITLGTYALSAGYYDAYYGSAQRAREKICTDFENTFAEGIDALLLPTTPTPAFRLGEKLDDPLQMYLSDVYTVTANLAGLPAMSVPIAMDPLPIGGQVIAPWWAEDRLVAIGGALEAELALDLSVSEGTS